MLTGRQRPVPSKATLQVLYQLAYISSGTAVGIGFLCAEERRRRTQIVQRIADNAKKIRQSPRYAHNAAAAAVREAEEQFYHAPDVRSGPLDGEAEKRQRRRGLAAGFHDGAKGPELPSVVAEAYEQHQSSIEEGVAQSRRKHAPERLLAGSHDTHGDSSAPDIINTGGRSITGDASVDTAGQPRVKHGPGRTRLVASHADHLYLECRRESVTSGTRSLAHARALRYVNEKDRTNDTEKARPAAIHPTDFKTLSVSGGALPLDDIHNDEIVHDVALFRELTIDTLHHLDIQELRIIWCSLLTSSARKGLCRQVRLMCRWAREQMLLDWPDHNVVATLCHECETLFRRSKSSDLFDLYVEIFDLARNTPFPQILSVLDKALTWNIDATPGERAEALLGKVGPARQKALFTCLSDSCLQTALAGEGDDAAQQRSGFEGAGRHRQSELLLAVAPMVKDMPGLEDLLGGVFNDALFRGQLSACLNLLRTGDGLISCVGSRKRCEDFLIACEARDAYSLVRELFKDSSWPHRPPVTQLSGRCRKIVLRARAADEVITHKTVQDMRLPKRQSAALIVQGLRIRLMHVWRATYDRDRVNSELRAVRNSLERFGDDQTRRHFQIANLEFCIFSNQMEPALRALSALYAASPSEPDIISLAAVLFAKRDAWEALTKLLARARDDQRFDTSADGTRRMNAVIGLHARSFHAAETWKFVTELVAEHGFRPNLATTEAMLKMFVSQRTIGLIPHWFAYLGSLGVEVRLDSNLVTALLRRYWRDNYPSHVLMMNFCRSLNQLAPTLKGRGYVDVLKDSIGHDLRLARRSNHSSRQVVRPDHIEARLERVELLSSPGKPWDGILVFGSHQRQVSDRSATSDSNEIVDEHDHTGRDHDLISQPAHHPPAVADPNEHLLEHCHDISNTVDQMASHESSPARLSDRAPAESDVEFSDLRVPYKNVCSVSQDESSIEKELDDVAPGLDELDLKPERDMILALSAGEYEKVLSLYKASTHKAQSFRNSPLALEVAVEASLRRRIGDPAEAMQLMKEAHAAGLNATIAMGPVLIHRMRSLNFEDHKNLENLRTAAIDYYRLNDEKGWPVKHHVGVAAASIMINGGQPRHGLNLLDAIFRSEYSRRRPLGIVAMSVYLQGYARIKNFTGIEWVVGQVLEQNMRIDRAFCHILKRCAKAFSSDDVLDFDGTRRQDLQQKQVHMRHLLEKCRARRLEQRVGFYKLGQALVKTLVSVAKQQARPVIDLAPVAHIETPASGVNGQNPASTEMLGSEDNGGDTPHSIIEQRSRRRRLAFLTRLGGGLQPGRSKARAKHRPYRRFLQPQMIGGERIYLSFRYHLPGPGAGHDRKPGAIRSPDPFNPVGGAPMNMRTLKPVSEDG